MRIIIKKLDSQKEPFDMDEKDTVKKLKEMLAEKAGIDKEQIRLILKGQPLLDDKTLGESKVKAGDVIHMVMQMRGGQQ